jgi:hypothetical protein
MNYHVFDLPLNSDSATIQRAINDTGETLVSIVADTINKRLIIVTKA